jgi:transcriptional regulator with PAS, ATPase and Fis domain
VGDLPLPLQVKLLRALQERTFERVGESVTRRSDARIIAATHLDLRRAVQEGRFRDDLFYRLRVVPIEIPPLRERRADVEPLAGHLLRKVTARHGRSLLLAPDARRALLRYPWPGNVREMENALEYAVAVCQGQTVHAEDLPAELLEMLPQTAPEQAPERTGERERLRSALETHHWRRDEAAKDLGMSRTTLWRKMRELQLIEM